MDLTRILKWVRMARWAVSVAGYGAHGSTRPAGPKVTKNCYMILFVRSAGKSV